MVYKFSDKKATAEPSAKHVIESGIKKDVTKSSSLILADELHKPVIKKFNKRKVYLQFKDNIW